MDDIVCNRCSLLCDDVLAELNDKEIKSMGLCRLGHAHLESMANLTVMDSISREGSKEKELSLEEALENAAQILSSAKNPILYGWSRCTNETITEGISLTRTINGTFDSTTSLGLLQSMKHDIHNMKLETNLDEVLNNGEFILYWGSNPVESSHRHASRFTVFPRGDKVPQGVESRVIGVIDVRETETMKMANHRIIIPVGKDKDLAAALSADLTGKGQSNPSELGISPNTLIGLSQALRKSDFTVIFYGSGIMNSGHIDENLAAIVELIKILQDMGKKAFALPMWHESNDMGILDAMQKAKTDIHEESTIRKLSRGDFDVSLIVCSDPFSSLPNNAAKGLAKTKIIYIGPREGLTESKAQLSLRVTDDIISGKGTMTRVDMKEVPLKTWGGTEQSSPTVQEIITQLHQRIQKKVGK